MTLEVFLEMLVQMAKASLTTLELFGLTLLFSLPLGLLVAVARMSRFKPLSWLIRLYLLVMRGTPLLLQLIFSISASIYSASTCSVFRRLSWPLR